MQLAAVIAIVGLAAAYVVRSAWRTWFGATSGCAAACGKCTKAPEPHPGRISLPQV